MDKNKFHALEYEGAATTLKEKNIELAKVDCNEEADLRQSYGIKDYPTLKVFCGLDKVSDYNGRYVAFNIISYIVKQSLPTISSLNKDTLENFKKNRSDRVVVVVAYIAQDDKTSTKVFQTVVDKYRNYYYTNYVFGSIADAAVAETENIKVPAVFLYKAFDEGNNIMKDNKLFDADAIEEFIKTAGTPLIGEINEQFFAISSPCLYCCEDWGEAYEACNRSQAYC